MRKLSIVLTVLLSVLLAFVACDNSIDIGLDTKVEVKEIRLNETELDISTGEEASLVATVLPEDATDKSVTWSSSDEDVATVDANGKVTGVGAGEATITVTSNSDNTVYETCSVKVAVNPYEIPLTLEFKNAGKIWVNYIGANPAPVKISISGRSLEELEEDEEVSVDAGDVIRFYRDVVGAKVSYPSFTINCKDSDCFVYGNAMSVLYGDQFVGKTEVPSCAFLELFSNNTHIINHDEIDLVLPATSLSENCYAFMFKGCEGLTRAPELPATQLAEGCYACMFENCTGLTRAPELPAETLANHCYYCMFQGCESLTTAPVLPAETLADFCYNHMFYDCLNLNSITCLATNISAAECTSYWVSDVADEGTFTKNSTMSSWSTDSNGIPSGWKVEVYGQDIPLTFKFSAASDNAFTITNPSSKSLEYSINGGERQLYSSPVSVSAGDEVSFYSDGTGSSSDNPDKDMTIKCNADCIVYGNVMSLISKDNFKDLSTLPSNYVFSYLFKDNTHLLSAERLVLPATSLTAHCYRSMFSGCSKLTTAPAILPAKTMAGQSYQHMFRNCTSLTSAPELPATTMSTSCYAGMFQGCTSLETAPELPATNLTGGTCYAQMFNGCSKLSSITCLAESGISGNCGDWVKGVAATGIFTRLSNEVTWSQGDNGYPTGWTLEDYYK